MEANFWLDRWTNNEIGWHEKDFHPLLTGHLHELALPHGSRVFVPLCGKTRDIAWLLQRGYQVAGSELSELAVQQLFEELGVQASVTTVGKSQRYQAPMLDIFTGDLFELTQAQLGPVQAIYDRAALVALPPDMRIRYTKHLLAVTRNAPQLLICFEYDQNQMAGPPHSVPGPEVWHHYGSTYSLTFAESRPMPIRGTPADEVVWLLK
ncbi:MAG: thiopurine S-methyltransferase [Pseudomonadota bacterium]